MMIRKIASTLRAIADKLDPMDPPEKLNMVVLFPNYQAAQRARRNSKISDEITFAWPENLRLLHMRTPQQIIIHPDIHPEFVEMPEGNLMQILRHRQLVYGDNYTFLRI